MIDYRLAYSAWDAVLYPTQIDRLVSLYNEHNHHYD